MSTKISQPDLPFTVQVKALEWSRKSIDGSMHMADSLLGEYRVWDIGDDAYFWREPWPSGRKAGSNKDDAKAAAQADFEARILSSLTSPAAIPEGEVKPIAWREALQAMLDHYGPPSTVAGMCEYDVDHPISLARKALAEE